MRRRELIKLLGGVLIAPRGAGAEQKPMPVIGFLGAGSPGALAALTAAFREGLSQTGWVEGQNVMIEYRWAEGHHDRLPALAADLVERKVDVIAAMGGTPPAVAAKGATSTIPIVFAGGDPVERGLVASLARPGGNLTGVSSLDLSPKRFEMLSELVPGAKLIALLVNPNNPFAETTTTNAQEAARTKGCSFMSLKSAAKARSMLLSQPSRKPMSTGSSNPATRYSTAGLTNSWRWHHAMPFQRSTTGVNTPRPAA
jgi:putative tryptophan/tyrosine transport system substrate-binding protein